jgi:hypothetical protein
MKILLSVVVAALSFGLGPSALASGVSVTDRSIDCDDLIAELILRGGLAGQPFVSPFGLSPFGLSPFVLNFCLIEELIDEAVEDRERDRFDFDRDRFDFDRPRANFDRDRFDFDRDRFDFDRPRANVDRDRFDFDRPRANVDRERFAPRRFDRD